MSYDKKEIFTIFMAAFGGKIVIAILLVCLLFAYNKANADEGDFVLNLTIASYHQDREYCHEGICGKRYNENNLGLGIKYGLGDNFDLIGGFFDNSFDHTSFYVGMNIHREFKFMDGILKISPGIVLGGATGYEDTPQRTYAFGLTPLAIPNINFEVNHAQLNVGYIPAIGDGTTNVLALQLGWKY